MIINVQEPREARKLMTINVQLMIINVKKPREAQTSVVHHDAALHLAVCRLAL